MESKLYNITRKMRKLDHSRIMYEYVWSIPDFMWLLDNQTNREIRTEKSGVSKDDDEDEDDSIEEYPFQVKMKFVGHENVMIEIYYRYFESASLKVSVGRPIFEYSNYSSSYIMSSKCNELSDQPYKWIQNNKWQFLTRMLKTNLRNGIELHKEHLYLKFCFEVCHINNTTELPPCLQDEELFDVPKSSLVNDQTNLLLNPTLSDVTLKSVDGDEFPAHKIFLANRSPVLKAHFEHNTVESVTNIIECPFESDVVKDVLTYIYTDNAPNMNDLSKKLLAAADFYQLDGLKKLGEIALEKKLNVENAIDTLLLANLHKANYLKRKSIEFIKDGLAGDITETEGWKKLESPDLIKSIYECVVKDKPVWS